MKLLLLGTAGYHPSESRHTACLLLPEVGVMLDAGSGMFRAAARLAADQLDIFLSHAHLDHVLGLTYLLNVVRGHALCRVRVHGDAAKLAAVREHLFSNDLFPVLPTAEFCPLAGPVDLLQGGRLTHFPLPHPGGSRGFRLDWPGHSLAYVTDTTAHPAAPYVAHVRGVDLLVHECNFRDGEEDWAELTGHSCTTPVAQVAAAAGVGRLVLVHINPLADDADPVDLAAARRVFPQVEVGRDLQELEF